MVSRLAFIGRATGTMDAANVNVDALGQLVGMGFDVDLAAAALAR